MTQIYNQQCLRLSLLGCFFLIGSVCWMIFYEGFDKNQRENNPPFLTQYLIIYEKDQVDYRPDLASSTQNRKKIFEKPQNQRRVKNLQNIVDSEIQLRVEQNNDQRKRASKEYLEGSIFNKYEISPKIFQKLFRKLQQSIIFNQDNINSFGSQQIQQQKIINRVRYILQKIQKSKDIKEGQLKKYLDYGLLQHFHKSNHISNKQKDLLILKEQFQSTTIRSGNEKQSFNQNKIIKSNQMQFFPSINIATPTCISNFQSFSSQYSLASLVLTITYWALFMFACLSCQKLYAVETLFVLQFVFMSYIPIGVFCPPFDSFKILRYSFGWNEIPFGFDHQINPSFYFNSLEIKSHFLSNLNLMIFFLPLCPIIHLIMTFLGDNIQGYRAKPRLLTYGKSFLYQIPYTILLVNTPNIIVSFNVSFSTYQATDILSFVSSLVMLLLICIGFLLFIIFRNNFREYKVEFCERLKIFQISIEYSTAIRRFYPLLLFGEIISISLVLSVQSIFNLSLYICLGITVFVTVIMIIITPYNSTIDNVRLFLHRFLFVTIVCVQIGFQIMSKESHSASSMYYQYPWIVLVLLILLAGGLSGPYFVFNAIKWVLKDGMIDVELYNKGRQIHKKPFNPFPENLNPVYYPALEYSAFSREDRENILNQLKEEQKVARKNSKVNSRKSSTASKQ